MRVILREEELNFNENWLNVTTYHETRPDEIYKLSYNFQVLQEIKTFIAKVSISLPNSNGNLVAIQNTVSDVCKYLKNSKSNLLLNIFFNGNFGSKKFPSSCPIQPDMYYIENFRINDNLLKIRAVETKFQVTVDFCSKLENNKLHCVVNMKFFGEIKDQNKWQQEVEKKRKNGH